MVNPSGREGEGRGRVTRWRTSNALTTIIAGSDMKPGDRVIAFRSEVMKAEMKRMTYIAVVGALLVPAPLPAMAAEGSNYMQLGPGGDSCGAWTQGRNDKNPEQNWRQFWVLGYITSMNEWVLPMDRAATRNLSEGADVAGLFADIDNYCASKPLSDLADATTALVLDLLKKWYLAHPPPRARK
jgi:hypothetical protein